MTPQPEENDRRFWVVSRATKSYTSTTIIEADTAREAAEQFTLSVWEMRRGVLLAVQPWKPTQAFLCEYAIKGSDDADFWSGGGPSHPVTIERDAADFWTEASA